MKKKLILGVFFVLLSIAVVFSLISCTGEGDGGGGGNASGNITLKLSTPGLSSDENGYATGTGTFVVKDGNLDSYELVVKGPDADDEYSGIRYKITRTKSRDASGFYAGILEGTMEMQIFPLNGIDDEVPAFDSSGDYYKSKGELVWNENQLTSFTGYDWESGDWVLGGKTAFEYNDDGTLKDIREGDYEDPEWFYDDADWYSEYDTTFTNYPTLIYDFGASAEQNSIPDNYDYLGNLDSYMKDKDIKYTYYPDSNGRIGTIEEQDWNGSAFENSMKIEITYDSSGNLSIARIYYDWDSDNQEWESALQLEFTVPSGLSFTLDNLFFPPWNDIILPFFN